MKLTPLLLGGALCLVFWHASAAVRTSEPLNVPSESLNAFGEPEMATPQKYTASQVTITHPATLDPLTVKGKDGKTSLKIDKAGNITVAAPAAARLLSVNDIYYILGDSRSAQWSRVWVEIFKTNAFAVGRTATVTNMSKSSEGLLYASNQVKNVLVPLLKPAAGQRAYAIWWVGANDGYQIMNNFDAYCAGVSNTLKSLRDNGITTVVLGLDQFAGASGNIGGYGVGGANNNDHAGYGNNPFQGHIRKFNAWLQNLNQTDIYVDLDGVLECNPYDPNGAYSDNLHLNDQGHLRLAKYVSQVIMQGGSGPVSPNRITWNYSRFKQHMPIREAQVNKVHIFTGVDGAYWPTNAGKAYPNAWITLPGCWMTFSNEWCSANWRVPIGMGWTNLIVKIALCGISGHTNQSCRVTTTAWSLNASNQVFFAAGPSPQVRNLSGISCTNLTYLVTTNTFPDDHSFRGFNVSFDGLNGSGPVTNHIVVYDVSAEGF